MELQMSIRQKFMMLQDFIIMKWNEILLKLQDFHETIS